ncbi:MAG: carbohydrate ABC transporter permease [Chloroflexota bacterium]
MSTQAAVSPRRRRKKRNVISNIALYLILLVFFLPSVWIAITSIRARIEINAFPPIWIPDLSKLNIDSYKTLFGLATEGPFVATNIPFLDYARNSTIVSLVSTLISLVFGTLAGYVFARFRFKAKNGVFLSMMLARAVPGIALSLPLFILFANLGLSDSMIGMIIIYVAMNVPFTAWLMDGFFRAIPRELDEAAIVDGCTHWTAFLRVDLPLCLPGVAASGIFAFLTTWNEFALASQITRTPSSRTFPPALFEFTGQYVSDWRGMCAMSVMMLIPAVIFVILVQRQLMEGLTSGAIKG